MKRIRIIIILLVLLMLNGCGNEANVPFSGSNAPPDTAAMAQEKDPGSVTDVSSQIVIRESAEQTDGKEPEANLYLIDKMTAAAVSKGIRPVVVFTKCDLSSAEELTAIYKAVNIPVYEFSSLDLRGLDEIKAELKDSVTAFCGNSGVGKSTLLNALFPELELRTGEISDKLGRGRHTTRTVELFKKHGGYIADTPGFSTVDIERFELIRKDELKFAFPEFEEYFGTCQFNSCNHLCEKGCRVLEAVERGVIPESRHDSYVRMYNEVKDIKDWQMIDKQ